jgi:hypothetical protein
VDFSILKMEEIRSSETSVYAPFTQRPIPEDDMVRTNSLSSQTRERERERERERKKER